MAVLDWCHLFGNRSDDLHWNNIVSDADEFKRNILHTLGMSEAEWTTYWESVKDYRDKDVAHIEVRPRPEKEAPEMDKALELIELYYIYAISELHEANVYMELPRKLTHFIHEVSGSAKNYVQSRVVNLFEYTDQT